MAVLKSLTQKCLTLFMVSGLGACASNTVISQDAAPTITHSISKTVTPKEKAEKVMLSPAQVNNVIRSLKAEVVLSKKAGQK